MDSTKNQYNHKRIKDWHDDDKPREKLVSIGAEYLSDAELLAILIKTGTKQYSALDIAKELLSNFGSLSALVKCDYSQFREPKGMGDVKAITLAAAFEISRRVESKPFDRKKTINSPDDVAKYYINKLKDESIEKFYTLLLNSANQIIREVLISKGSINESIVHPREVFKIAITESAASIILLHNHPSGNPMPSHPDKEITKRLMKSGKTLGIEVLDHIIIAGARYTSMKSEGLMD